MSDYTKNVDYAAKDALADGDPDKLILGTEIDAEFVEIATAIGTKYDSSDIASVAEAQAGVSNTTLITPARLNAVLAGTGGSGAGAVADIVALTDPGADRILFWDDSADHVDWLSLASNLSITGTQLAVVPGQIDITSLLNYSANKFLDHTTISVLAGSGLTGGGTIDADRTLSLNIPGLTEDTSPDTSADYVVTYDTSGTSHKKVLANNLVGPPVGDGRWYSSAGQALGVGVTSTIVFDTAAADNLQRGTFSLATGLYTASNASGARVLITATIAVASLGASRSFSGFILKNGGIITRASLNNFGGVATTPYVTLSAVVSLSFNETVGVGGFVTTAANTIQGGEAYTSVSIVELG